MESGTCGISELAREFGITARAIRFYEDRGLLAPQRTGPGGQRRIFSQRDRVRLSLLLRGKRLGLSLDEIRSLLDIYETPADTIPQLQRFLKLLDERRATLNRQLQDLVQTLADLDASRAQAEQVLAALRPESANAGMEPVDPTTAARSPIAPAL
ncbi:MAG: MerR family DNA-binding transcriptional regulator [Lautropia sp.]